MTDPEKKPGRNGSTDLPVWLRGGIIGALAATLVAHIMIDIFRDTYEGAGTSLMLGTIIGAAIGVNEFLRGRSQ